MVIEEDIFNQITRKSPPLQQHGKISKRVASNEVVLHLALYEKLLIGNMVVVFLVLILNLFFKPASYLVVLVTVIINGYFFKKTKEEKERLIKKYQL